MEKTETQPEEFRVSAAGAELFVRKQGRGPGLLLIHGVACDCDYFTETARCLKQQFTVLTYDRRGYSRSHLLYTGNADGAEAAGYVPEQQTPRVQAEDAAAVIRASGLRNVFVAGSSAGGVVAAELALTHPELVTGLFLHEPFFCGTAEVEEEAGALAGKLQEAGKNGRVIRAMRAFIQCMGGVDQRAISKSLAQQARDLENLQFFLKYEMESFFAADIGRLRQIAVPAWIGVGEGTVERCVPGYHNFPSDLPRGIRGGGRRGVLSAGRNRLRIALLFTPFTVTSQIHWKFASRMGFAHSLLMF